MLQPDIEPQMKTIAVDLDDTLNNFTETLQNTDFPYDASYAISKDRFQIYIDRLRGNAPDPSEFLSTEYSFFSYKIHHLCYGLAAARPDGVKFMQWLKANRWKIVICTHRDLRRANDTTRKWLKDNRIPFDYLFMASNKLEFCWMWGIEYLVDDHSFYVSCGSGFGVKVFYPIMSKHEALPPHQATGFHHFDEVRQWIQN